MTQWFLYLYSEKERQKSGGKKRKSEENLAPSAKRKRVSFGPKLSPEHFDKKLPPSTPVRRGAMPPRLVSESPASPAPVLKRRSVALKLKTSPIREESPVKSPPKSSKKSTPKTVTPKEASRSRSTSPKSAQKKTPGRRQSKSPKAKTPKTASRSRSLTPTSGQGSKKKKTPKSTPRSRSLSPKSVSPASSVPAAASIKKSPAKTVTPRKRSVSPKAGPSEAEKGRTPSANTPKAVTPTRKSRSLSPKVVTPVKASPKPGTPKASRPSASPKASSARKSAKKSPKTVTPKSGRGRKSVGKGIGDASLTGVKKLLKTPRNQNNSNVADISFSGIAELMKTPIVSSPGSARSKAKKSTSPIKAVKSGTKPALKTPRGGKILKRKRSSPVHMNVKRMKMSTPSATPPVPVSRAVVLRAIHGKQATPKLKTWADVVKKGGAVQGVAKRKTPVKPKPVQAVKPPTPKPPTPRPAKVSFL